ncbi:right-handed parallel beta-helix repeat-containing protein [Cellulomonas chitinilytica]|nr:right-handed parallel beta-helix repeat-containing protein [Cellulomonas chitinilytica]
MPGHTHVTTRRSAVAARALAVAALGAAALTVGPAAQAVAPPACGSTLSEDTTLTADVRCPGASPAFHLAKGVTLDLGGHAVVGNGSGSAISAAPEGATVRNGTVRGWGVAVSNKPANPDAESDPLTLLVEDVRLADNRVALRTQGEFLGSWGPTVVRRTTFSGNETGLDITWYGVATVEDSVFKDNGTAISSDASAVQVSGTAFSRNAQGLSGNEASFLVDASRFVGNTSGISVGGTSSLTLRGSTVSGSDTAVSAGLGYVVIEGSTLSRNTSAVVTELAGGLISGTTFRDNGVAFNATQAPYYWDLVLQDNVVVRNGDGIVTQPTDEDWTLLQLGGNRVENNTGWGIHTPGVTDLGGNTARRNGNEPQCTGVVCVPRPS